MKSLNNTLQGVPASPGKAVGNIFILDNDSDVSKMLDGDIVLMFELDMQRFPLVKAKASGFILEEASINSHISTAVREAGKPCIVQAKGIRDILKNGMKVELDGATGIISIL